ncbi:MAG: HD domain-containing protein [Acholeplasmataceae bacterium]|nr:HD domain-containing protein [Acholeplasmataceae bacterium]
MEPHILLDLVSHVDFGYAVYNKTEEIWIAKNPMFDLIKKKYEEENLSKNKPNMFLSFLFALKRDKIYERFLYLKNQIIKIQLADDPNLLFVYLYDVTKPYLDYSLLLPDQKKYEGFSLHNFSFVWEFDTNGKYTYVDEYFTPILGYLPDEVVGKFHFYDFLSDEIRDDIKNIAFDTFEKHESFGNIINKKISKTGHPIWLLTSGMPVFDKEGIYIGYRGIDTDITKWIESEEKSNSYHQKYLTVFKHSPLGMVQYDLNGKLVVYNDKFLEIIDIKKRLIEEMNIKSLFGSQLLNVFEESQKGIANRSKGTLYNPFSDNKIPVVVDFLPQFENKFLTGGILIIEDLRSELKKEKEMKKILRIDYLTNTYNRRSFDEDVLEFKESDLPIYFILADINGIRVYNESFGFEVGDKIITYVAGVLKKFMKHPMKVYRVGGDEFGFFIKNAELDDAEELIELIKKELNNHPFEFDIHVSFGYADIEKLNKPFPEVFMHAEKMLFSQKVYDGSSVSLRTVDVIMATLFEKSKRELNHSRRVSSMSYHIAKHLNLGATFEEKVKLSGLLHDIGKINIDSNILNKADDLTEEEWKIIKEHPRTGYMILNAVEEYRDVANIVLSHHERYDGTGYPRGLAGSYIPLEARVVSVADAYDAMTQDRTYRKALSTEDAILELRRGKGKQFDPRIVEVFITKVLKKS